MNEKLYILEFFIKNKWVSSLEVQHAYTSTPPIESVQNGGQYVFAYFDIKECRQVLLNASKLFDRVRIAIYERKGENDVG